jgi:Cu+-exporting ATPase
MTRTIVLEINGMSCNNCVGRVARALRAVPGVADARVTLQPGRAEVDGDSTVNAAALAELLAAKGYPTRVVE